MIWQLQKAFWEALNILEIQPDCAGAVTGSNSADSAEEILEGTSYRILPLPSSSNGAQTNSETSVFINQTGVFFANSPSGTVTFNVPNPTNGGLVAVSLPQVDLQAFILLHELGHQSGNFGPDLNATVNGQNSWTVLENCFGLQAPQ
jgi:hypothetical protein